MSEELKLNFIDGSTFNISKSSITDIKYIIDMIKDRLEDKNPQYTIYELFVLGEEDAIKVYNNEDVLYCLFRLPDRIYSNVYVVGAVYTDRLNVCDNYLIREHIITKLTPKFVSIKTTTRYDISDLSAEYDQLRNQPPTISTKRKKIIQYEDFETNEFKETIYNRFYYLRASNFYIET